MMSNEEEKRCPLCAEEMDWTDQQFKPCKCGYQVCVWCWHQVMDMAEKEATEGRCPACRVVYEKDKIVAMQANCERMVGKKSSRKTKPPKAKPKSVEVKRDLTNVRVIQRKMAYVIGLPVSLADEDLLQRKEYFGQYGKVTKISLSRTAGGSLQQFVNDTCSVYVTFSKEEEALRCIQWVHDFVLDGRILRASFGTAKYCHAWLKNMPCNNSACLYLHSLGADEDSFGKDEVAAVHTRSRVHEMVGVASTGVKRSGNVLPRPVDDAYCTTSIFPDKSTVGSPTSDSDRSPVDSSSVDMTCSLGSREREVSITAPPKVTSFVDIVGRGNNSGSEKDESFPEDRTISQLGSELSSVSIGADLNPTEAYSVPTVLKVSSSNIGNGVYRSSPDESPRALFDSSVLKDTSASSQKTCSLPPSDNITISEAGCPASMQKTTHSQSDTNVVYNAVRNHDDKGSSHTKYVNPILNDVSQEMRFRNSAKSDRIYRSSNSFSNEEIVQHLRRIGGDDFTSDEENSALNVVENSIISNIMSIDFDSYDDPLSTGRLSELHAESNGVHNSSWNSFSSDQSGYSFVKPDSFSSQITGPIFPEYGDSQDNYLSNPPYSVTRTQSLAPPGFSVPCRDPPPGFSTGERTSFLPRALSGGHLVSQSLSSPYQQPYTTATVGGYNNNNGSMNDDFLDPAILSYGKPTNEVKNYQLRPTPPQQFDDSSRLWNLVQQQSASTNRDSQMYATPQPHSSYMQQQDFSSNGYNNTSLSSQRHNYNHHNQQPSSFVHLPPHQQKYATNTSSNNGYHHHHINRGGEGNYYHQQGYNGDQIFNSSSSSDVFNRVFGL